MKLIEKKCPNCGAGLEFKDNDKNCKCSHCGSSFEIERDTNKADLDEQFDLKPLDRSFSILAFVIYLFIFVVVFGLIAVILHILFNASKTNSSKISQSSEVYSNITYITNKN